MVIEVSKDGRNWIKAFEFKGNGIPNSSEFWILSLYKYVKVM